MHHALLATDLNLPLLRRGKVRDVYDLGADRLLIVATDRISAFDVVMPTPIPGKGRVLNTMAVFWLRFVQDRGICPTHLISTDHASVPDHAFIKGGTTRADLEGRVMIGKACRVVPIECVVRGYLEGSGWKEYQASRSVCGVPLPSGLRQGDRLPAPIFTPATKEEDGRHDENITFDQAAQRAGQGVMTKLREISLAIYAAAAAHAHARGVLIADTKFEFGIPQGSSDPILIDEALTPDSSRFWPADAYAPGGSQVSYDKQFLREYLEKLVAAGTWNKQSPGPDLPDAIVRGTMDKYEQALAALTRP
jgi:phosphoribosylaminoimidazole-succinocarboxamide synthase